MKTWQLLLFSQILLCSATLTLGEDINQTEELWTEILGSPKATVPPDPGGKVVWRTDFYAALKEAQEDARPMFVTWRCIPCKQCAEFDKNVLEGSEKLDPLLRRFVTVRMIDAGQLDQRYFPYLTHQDLDLSWWGYFLRSDGGLYGVFGGKDHVSDSTRISEAALVNSLDRVLKHHYDPRRESWDIDSSQPDPSATKVGPKDSRGYELLLEKYPGLAKPDPKLGSCVHCHQVGDMRNLEAIKTGTFSVEKVMQQWPLPENVGILLDRDDGLLVKSVAPESVAAKAGVLAGDRLGMANGVRLFGQADFRGVLHRASYEADTILIGWIRDGEVHTGTLTVENGWRTAENSWRKTIYSGVYGPNMGFFPLEGPRSGNGEGLSIKPWMGPEPSERPVYATGLRPHMEIVAIDGMDQDMNIRKLITWFRFNHKDGDEVIYTVKGGKEFKYVLPDKE
ncbi:MAG: thioredoxin family protein [Verrucomicrobiae bacterium]|nr:thioredoxin family protein [Verrucomicrobiae bacterium]